MGLPVEIHINSIGTLEERRVYLDELVNYYRSKRAYLCPDCRERISKNPLRLLDCKAAQCQPVKDNAPQMIDWLGSVSKNHFTKVLEYLDDLEVPYVLRSTLVRGLDYYNNTVFEVYQTIGEDDDPNDEARQSALGGGGRYDGLVEIVGGKPTPAIGMALGVDRIIAAVKAQCEKNKLPWPNEITDVFFAQLGDDARRVTLRALNQFRNSGLNVAYNFFKNSLKAQLELANSLKVPFVVIFGQKEVQDKTAIIRDMESGVQEIVDQRKLEAVLKKKLGKV
jgi:histidyl-tRNA synthetase